MLQQSPDTKGLSEVVFAWRCPEYAKYPKNFWWYVISLPVAAIFIAWSVYTLNYLFAIFIILFYLVTLMYEFREPQIVDCAITPDGVKHGRRFFFFKELDDFFIIYRDHGPKNLYLDFKNPLKGRLVIDLADQDAVVLREFLLGFLKEDLEREEEPLSERLQRWLKI